MRSLAEAALSPAHVASAGLCIGCGGCALTDPAARMAIAPDGQFKPAGPPEWTKRESATLARTCPFSPHAANEDEIAAALFPAAGGGDGLTGRYLSAHVGHAAQGAFRANGSSGGMASWIAAELLRRGLVDGVAHVSPRPPTAQDGRLFAYGISRDAAALNAGAKSRYYPVELSAVLREIEVVPGRYAVIGIPCFIKAVNLWRRENPLLADRIAFTIGLFCGHMKSAHMAGSFAWQSGIAPPALAAIDYRHKQPDRPANWYAARLVGADGSSRVADWWNLVDGDWGAGFFMNSACNFCDDVMAETADVALGDAWLEPYSSDGRGTNVVVVRSAAMEQLVAQGIANGALDLSPVDAGFVARTQAAGLRQRREGLAYRLAVSDLPITPRKRVVPSRAIPARRKLIYRMRMAITRWSVPAYRTARALGWRGFYTGWARLALAAYHGLAYSRGRLGRLVDRIIDPARTGAD